MSVKLREKKKANGEVSLYLDIYDRGKRKREHLSLYLSKDRDKNKQVRRLAEDIRSKRQLELSANNYQVTPQFKSQVNFIEYFASISKESHRSWQTTLGHLIDFAGKTVPFHVVDERWLINFQKYLLNLVAANAAQTYFNKIKASLNRAKRDKLIQSNPADNIENIKGRDVEKVYLTFEEIKILNDAPCYRDDVKRAFLFCCFTGLRLSDVKRLQWKHVQGEQLALRIKKTGQREYLPISQSALTFLSQRTSDIDKIFPLPGEQTIWSALQRWAKAAGIQKHISFHVSRHTFATLALTSGVDLYTVSKLLGHTNIKNTQIYAQIIDQKKKDAVNLMPTL